MPVWRVVLRLTGIAAVLAVLGLALLGLPGAAWMELGSPLAGLFTRQRLPADGGWPMAILVTELWPWLLPLSYLGVASVLPRGALRWVMTLAVTALGATALAAGFQVAYGRVG